MPFDFKAILICLLSVAIGGTVAFCSEVPFSLPTGYQAELAAGPSLVGHPLMATFDHKGRLYVAASAGENLKRAELEARLPNFVQRLEDTDGDGVFDHATVFADNLTFPQGCLWWEGSLYVASSGAIWKFTDLNEDGVADERVKLVGDFGYTGNAADIHGPFAGPDGRIYWCDGRHGYELKDAEGKLLSRGKSSRIFSCWPDGSDVRTYCSGGMDNPVEVVFLPNGEMLGTVNLMYSHPRGDCLVNWQFGGVYPREDFVGALDVEFRRTGPLLSELYNFGHIAISGLCRWEQAADASAAESVLTTEFNTNSVKQVLLSRAESGVLSAEVKDFVNSENRDFHPTDILEDADGSLLLIDTGGWFRFGCPQSEVAKADLLGGIYRIRSTKVKVIEDPRGLKLNWDSPSLAELIQRLEDSRSAVRDRAVELLGVELRREENLAQVPELSRSLAVKSPATRQFWIQALARANRPAARQQIATYVEDPDAAVRQLAIRALLYAPASEFRSDDQLFAAFLKCIEQGNLLESRLALATASELFAARPGFAAAILKAVRPVTNNEDWRHAFVLALIASDDRESLAAALFDSDAAIQSAVADALAELRRPRPETSELAWLEIPAAGEGQKLTKLDQQTLIDLAAKLSAGDVQRGREIFQSERAACLKCHRINKEGGMVGPDLSTVGRSRSSMDLLESILFPSATFARGFAPYAVITEEGRVFTGIVLTESSTHLRLGLDKEQSVSIPNADIEEIRAVDTSIMPADVAKGLTPSELSDLIAYLQSLR